MTGSVRTTAFAVLSYALAFFWATGASSGQDARRFLEPGAWQCTFRAEARGQFQGGVGPTGAPYEAHGRFLALLARADARREPAGGWTDRYSLKTEQRLEGRVRLHHTYDGGPDGLQLAGWKRIEAEVHIRTDLEGTEQKQTFTRRQTATFDGTVSAEGEDYEPPFQIWISPEEGSYAIEYWLPPVRGTLVETCRMNKGLEDERRRMEAARDADMPLGGLAASLVRVACATETRSEVDIEGDVLSAFVENVPLPASGLALEGEGKDPNSGVSVRWSCRPE